jgi:hypothetical protein
MQKSTLKIGSNVAVPTGVSKELYRTKICNFYKEKKECRFKERCFFAHGEKELRPMVSKIRESE